MFIEGQFSKNLLYAYLTATLLLIVGAVVLFKLQWDATIENAKSLASKDLRISGVIANSVLSDGLILLDATNRDLSQLVDRDTFQATNVEGVILTAITLFGKSNQLDNYGLLLVTDRDGMLVARSDGNQTDEINFGDRYYFQDLKTNPEKAYTIGPMVLARTTGEWIFHVATPITGKNEGFVGALILQIDGNAMSESIDYAIGASDLSITAVLPNDEIAFATLSNHFNPNSETGTNVAEVIDLSSQDESVLFGDKREMLVVQSGWYGFDLRYFSTKSMNVIYADFVETNQKLLWLVLFSYMVFSFLMWIIYRQFLATERDRLSSKTDSLTKLPNRRAFDERYEQFIKDANRTRTNVSVLFIDIDHFKECNDTYGHANGDLILRDLTAIVQASLRRPLDFLCRWGGEEFVVLLPTTGEAGALLIAKNILQSVREQPIKLRGFPPIKITVSIGISTADYLRQRSPINLVDSADQAMYRAKQGGRDRYSM